MTIRPSILRRVFMASLIALSAYAGVLAVHAAGKLVEEENLHSAEPTGSPVDPCTLKDVVCPEEDGKGARIEAQAAKTTPVAATKDTLTLKTTAFSSVECKTTWCRANAGKPRGLQVALNRKFGKAAAVYIPKFDKTYKVIGTTDYLTDLDVWFGDDQQSALQHGSQWLEVKIIK